MAGARYGLHPILGRRLHPSVRAVDVLAVGRENKFRCHTRAHDRNHGHRSTSSLDLRCSRSRVYEASAGTGRTGGNLIALDGVRSGNVLDFQPNEWVQGFRFSVRDLGQQRVVAVPHELLGSGVGPPAPNCLKHDCEIEVISVTSP